MTSMTTLKLSSCGAFLVLVLALTHQPALAQASEPAAPPAATTVPATAVPAMAAPEAAASAPAAPSIPRRHGSARYQRRSLDDRIAVLAKNLELTEAQRSAVKNILEQRQQQTLRIRNSAEPGNVRIGQFRALQDQTIAQIRAILTDEQKKKYDPMMVRKLPAPSTPQRSVEDWIKATTPPTPH